MKELKKMIQERMDRFSFAQMTSNNNGKTSGSGTMGVYIIIISVLCFVYGCIEFRISGKADVMMYASANILVGAGLLGYRKSKEPENTELITPVDLPAAEPCEQPVPEAKP